MKLITPTIAFMPDPASVPPGFHSLIRLPLVVIVGLTGVGKTTVLRLLRDQLEFTLLPNRRELTDDIIIASLQQADGQPVELETDRLKRFDYTARYRALHPGGMAYALTRLAIQSRPSASLLIFDGLRGLDEVEHASRYLPLARFVVLDAPDMVRLNRLLKRGDAFDSAGPATAASKSLLSTLAAIPGCDAVFSADQLQRIARETAPDAAGNLVKKVSIIVEERRNYDSGAARAYLTEQLPPRQALVIDTAAQPATAVAAQVKEWLAA